MSDIVYSRCHWHMGDDGVLTIYNGSGQIIVLEFTTEQKSCLSRDLAQRVAVEVAAMRRESRKVIG